MEQGNCWDERKKWTKEYKINGKKEAKGKEERKEARKSEMKRTDRK